MDSEQGLYGKYRITKANGEPVEGFKFVLSPETDPAAMVALVEYAKTTANRQLKDDLFKWILEFQRRLVK